MDSANKPTHTACRSTLPFLPLAFATRMVKFSGFTQKVAQTHRNAISNKVGKPHENDDLDTHKSACATDKPMSAVSYLNVQIGTNSGSHNGEGGDNAIQAAEHNTFNVLRSGTANKDMEE